MTRRISARLKNSDITIQRLTRAWGTGGGLDETFATIATVRGRLSQNSLMSRERMNGEKHEAIEQPILYVDPDVDIKRHDHVIITNEFGTATTYEVKTTQIPSIAHHKRVVVEEIEAGQ